MVTQDSLSGLQKASVLLMSLGASASAEILKHLSEQEIEMLTSAIVQTERVDPEIRDMVLEEFQRELAAAETSVAGGKDFAAQVLEQALGQEKASKLISHAGSQTSRNTLQSIWDMEPEKLAKIIGNEHPQIISLLLVNLPPNTAARLLSELEGEMQAEVATRICSMNEADPDVIAEIEAALLPEESSTAVEEVELSAGPPALVEILNNVDRVTERAVLDAMNARDEATWQQVRKMMFLFEDIIKLSDRSVQLVLREIDQDDLRLAVKGCSDEIKEVIFRNMSERAVESLKEDLELMERVKQKDIDEAQQRIASVARRLLASGEIALEEEESEAPKEESESAEGDKVEQPDQS
ncbi:MAG: flagellar motor switch protein FliG [Armatimonadota bacterium]|nr:flagellar motor switch protein FliG [Armatimonadota bacterium]